MDRREQTKSRPYLCVFGPLTIERTVYSAGNHQQEYAPLDAILGLPEGKFSFVVQDFAQMQLVDQQPDPGRFYFRMTREGKLVTNVPAGEALSYYVDAERKKQIYFHPGIAMAFLCHYYLAMDDSAALAAAETIFEFTQRCADDVYCFPPSGELGYSCAVLSAITNRPEARHAAEAVADYLVRTQVDEGYWRLPDDELYAIIEDKNDPEILLDTTAEFCTWLWEISALLP